MYIQPCNMKKQCEHQMFASPDVFSIVHNYVQNLCIL
jgi:hypothetical protein